MAIETTKRSSYTSPVEAIPDYGAFSRGFAQGIQPGLQFLKQKEEKEAIDKKRRELLGQKKIEAFDSIKLFNQLDTKATDMVDWDPNYAAQQKQNNLLKLKRADFVKAIAAGDEELQKSLFADISIMSVGSNNFNKLLQKATEQGYDLEASNTTIGQIQVGGKTQNVTLQDLAKLNKENPEAFDYNIKQGKYGNKSFFLDANYDGQIVSLNLSQLSDAKIEDMFALNADTQGLINQWNKNNKVSSVETKQKIEKIQEGNIITSTISKLSNPSKEAFQTSANNFAIATINNSDFNELKPSLLRQALEQEDMQGYSFFKDSEGKVSSLKDILAYLQTEDGIKDYATQRNITEDQARKNISIDIDNLLKQSLINKYLSKTGRYSFNSEKGVYEAKGIEINKTQKPIDEITIDEFQGLYNSVSNELDKNPKSFIDSDYQLGEKTGIIRNIETITREGTGKVETSVNKIKVDLVRLVSGKEVEMDPIIIDLDNITERRNFIINSFGKIPADLKSSLLKQGIQSSLPRFN